MRPVGGSCWPTLRRPTAGQQGGCSGGYGGFQHRPVPNRKGKKKEEDAEEMERNRAGAVSLSQLRESSCVFSPLLIPN